MPAILGGNPVWQFARVWAGFKHAPTIIVTIVYPIRMKFTHKYTGTTTYGRSWEGAQYGLPISTRPCRGAWPCAPTRFNPVGNFHTLGHGAPCPYNHYFNPVANSRRVGAGLKPAPSIPYQSGQQFSLLFETFKEKTPAVFQSRINPVSNFHGRSRGGCFIHTRFNPVSIRSAIFTLSQ